MLAFILVVSSVIIVVVLGGIAEVARDFLNRNLENWKRNRVHAAIRFKAQTELAAIDTKIRLKNGIGAKQSEVLPLLQRMVELHDVILRPEAYVDKDF